MSSDILPDRLMIRGLELQCVIGVEDWERRMPQRVIVDIELQGDFSDASVSDNLADALDYRTLCIRALEVAAASECGLVETLADRIAQAVLETHSRIASVTVSIFKPLALAEFGAARAVIEISRTC